MLVAKLKKFVSRFFCVVTKHHEKTDKVIGIEFHVFFKKANYWRNDRMRKWRKK